ncbi:MarR family winged helix-turn-helix transcriptional regulator [Kiloniella sp. b19]|uniref:MarR family winged helix-turn-helix transcriptional regulator n=1 Tax=Kiloniella sp. GXU_MW_B19 TaxID=3141326 RepID=UPI0031D0351B
MTEHTPEHDIPGQSKAAQDTTGQDSSKRDRSRQETSEPETVALPSPDETKAWIALNLAHRFIHRKMNSALKARGLPPLVWYDVLWSLERTETGALRPFELEQSVIFEQSNLSRLLRRMCEEGLLQESVYEADRRGKIIQITDKGKEVRQQMWSVYGPAIHSHFSPLSSATDIREIIKSLSSLIEDRDTPNPWGV